MFVFLFVCVLCIILLLTTHSYLKNYVSCRQSVSFFYDLVGLIISLLIFWNSRLFKDDICLCESYRLFNY